MERRPGLAPLKARSGSEGTGGRGIPEELGSRSRIAGWKMALPTHAAGPMWDPMEGNQFFCVGELRLATATLGGSMPTTSGPPPGTNGLDESAWAGLR